MIRVTVELWKGGDPARKETLAIMEIGNTGKNPRHPNQGDYNVRRFRGDGVPLAENRGAVFNHKRLAESVWELVLKAIAASRKGARSSTIPSLQRRVRS